MAKRRYLVECFTRRGSLPVSTWTFESKRVAHTAMRQIASESRFNGDVTDHQNVAHLVVQAITPNVDGVWDYEPGTNESTYSYSDWNAGAWVWTHF
jgi:hypothetical protein